MKRILVLLITIISITGYSQDVNVYDIDRKSFTNQNFYQIKDLINFFINDLEKFSKVYHHVNNVDESSFKSFIIKIRNSEIISDFDLSQDGILGLSKSIYDDTKITISINPIEWRNSSDEKKLYVLYHELGHDILNFEHGEGGKMMFSLSEEDYSLYDFLDDRDEMFNTFLKGFILKNENFIEFEEINNIENMKFSKPYKKNWTTGKNEGGFHFRGKKINGYFRQYYEDDSYRKGFLKDGIFTGKWKRRYKDQSYSIGNYINYFEDEVLLYEPSGEWLYYNKNDILTHSRFFLGSSYKYVEKSYYKSGGVKTEKVYESDLTSVLYHDKNSNIGLKNYIPRNSIGKSIEYFENGNIKKIEENGKFTNFFENGNVEETGQWTEKGQKTGKWETFWESSNKIKSETYYENGDEIEELSVLYNENGGKYQGEYIFYKKNESERIIRKYISQYKNGIKNGDYSSYYSYYDYPDYHLSVKGGYLDGVRNGMWYFYQYGKIRSEGSYFKGERQGEWSYYSTYLNVDNDVINYLKEKGTFVNDMKDGEWIEYFENGYEKEIKLYENGKFLKKL